MSACCTLLIPARRNSKRVPGKNTNVFAGKPLVRWSLDLWSRFDDLDIVVSTDDPRVMELATAYPRVRFLIRPDELAGDVTTLDELAYYMVKEHAISSEYFAIAQCTCPLVSEDTAGKLLDTLRSGAHGSIVAAVKEHGFFWKVPLAGGPPAQLFDERVNTQYSKSVFFRESGVFTASKVSQILASRSRFTKEPFLVEIPRSESLDIDDRLDWRVGQALRTRAPMVFVAVCNSTIGTGHLHRCLEIASWFSDLDQQLVVVEGDGCEQPILNAHNCSCINIGSASELAVCNSVVILDVLDVDPEIVARLQAAGNTVFAFESRTISRANYTFNSLYKPDADEGEQTRIAHGPRCAVTNKFLLLRENRFKFRDEVGNVVVFFGGTDPSRLRPRVVPLVDASFSGITVNVFSSALQDRKDAVTAAGNRIVERPLGPAFFDAIEEADLFIGSAGQTMMQVAHIGVPSVIISHSEREENHIFGDVVSCITYAGTASSLGDADIIRTIQYASSHYRRKLVSGYCRQFSLSRGNEFVYRTMRDLIDGTDSPTQLNLRATWS